MHLHVLVGVGAGVAEDLGVDRHAAALLAVTPARNEGRVEKKKKDGKDLLLRSANYSFVRGHI